MAKVFNVAADCKPDKHYMVNIDRKEKENEKEKNKAYQISCIIFDDDSSNQWFISNFAAGAGSRKVESGICHIMGRRNTAA